MDGSLTWMGAVTAGGLGCLSDLRKEAYWDFILSAEAVSEEGE